MGILANLLESDVNYLIESTIEQEIQKTGAYYYRPIFEEVAEVIYEEYANKVNSIEELRAILQEALDISTLTLALLETGNKEQNTNNPFSQDSYSPKEITSIKDKNECEKNGYAWIGNACYEPCRSGYVFDMKSNKCVRTIGGRLGAITYGAEQKLQHFTAHHPLAATAMGAAGVGLAAYGAYKLGKKIWNKIRGQE